MPKKRRISIKQFKKVQWSLLALFKSKTWVQGHPGVGISYQVMYVPPHVKERLLKGDVA